jgi:ABC-2 type transport system permease protein
MPAWIIGVTMFCAGFVPAMPSIAGSSDEMGILGELMKNPAMVAMCGLIYGSEVTLSIIYSQMMMVWSALVVAVMNILIVIRHTRTDEDEGRLEVIRALPTGRLANLGAVSVLMVYINVVVFLACGFFMGVFNVESFTVRGCLLYSAALATCGLFFAALTMVIVQIAHSSREAMGISTGLLGFFYILRAYGDVSSETLAVISPLGLIQRTYCFYEDRLMPVVILVSLSLVLMGLGFALSSLRDLGQGLLPNLGRARAHAPRTLSGEWGLTWRLTRSTILAWSATVFISAAAYGSVMGEMEDFVMSNPLYQQMMGIGANEKDITGPVVTMLVLIMGIIGTIPVLTTVFKLRSEEVQGRLDYVLGKSVSRWRLFIGYAGLAVIVSAVMLVLTAAGFWVVIQSVMTEPVSTPLIAKVAFNYFPALFAFGGLGLFLVGYAKKYTWVGWTYLVVSFLMTYMGSMMGLPRWAERLTPFGLLQRWPSEPFSWWPWIGLMVAGIVLGVLGALGFRRRDILT